MASRIPELLHRHRESLLEDWVAEQKAALGRRLVKDHELEQQCGSFLQALQACTASGRVDDGGGPAFDGLREQLGSLSRARGQAGYSPTETATFVFSFKKPLFALISAQLPPAEQANEIWAAGALLDQLGLYIMEVYQRAREEVIARQQTEMLELSTPVVKLWEGVLALPMIGTLDSARTQVVMESLLQRIVETGSAVAILDITGVPTVDTLVAQHLLKTVEAARLMGAECIVSGIRPQIAQTIVQLGVDLGSVITKSTLADAFALALQRTGRKVVRDRQPKAKPSATPGS
jgi:rsbT co-antagonist protein RsbR